MKKRLTFALAAFFAGCGAGMAGCWDPALPPSPPAVNTQKAGIDRYLKYIDVHCRAIGDQHECHRLAIEASRRGR